MAALAAMAEVRAQALVPAPQPRRLPPPSSALLRSLQGFQEDLERLDRSLLPAGPEADRSVGRDGAVPDALALPAPAATALPAAPEAVRIERRQRLSLAEALVVAVGNDPDLAAAVLSVREQQDLAGSARGRWWPELGLNLAGGFRQQRSYSQVWAGNDGIYPSGSPFLVSPQGWNVVQTNVGAAAARMELGWELISPYRAATIADSADAITWGVGDQGFDMVLSGRVPAILQQALAGPAGADLLHGRSPDEYGVWAVHGGGRAILDAPLLDLRLRVVSKHPD
jgi:hypothetical protein